jgi:hypothetical protein
MKSCCDAAAVLTQPGLLLLLASILVSGCRL